MTPHASSTPDCSGPKRGVRIAILCQQESDRIATDGTQPAAEFGGPVLAWCCDYGFHTAVGQPPNFGPQPVVPGRW